METIRLLALVDSISIIKHSDNTVQLISKVSHEITKIAIKAPIMS
jgi:hypothetical protein